MRGIAYVKPVGYSQSCWKGKIWPLVSLVLALLRTIAKQLLGLMEPRSALSFLHTSLALKNDLTALLHSSSLECDPSRVLVSIFNFRALSLGMQWHNATLPSRRTWLSSQQNQRTFFLWDPVMWTRHWSITVRLSPWFLYSSALNSYSLTGILCFFFQSFQNKTDTMNFLPAALQSFF